MPRPSKPLLSVDLIVDAALQAVDANGDFTMPGIAATLGVRPSSLYNHVGARSEIVELLRDRAMSTVLIPDETENDWAQRVAAIARSYRDAYAAHPRLIPLLTTHTVRSRAALAMYETLARAFGTAGLSPQQTLDAITVLDAFVLGSALDLAAPEQVWEAAVDIDPAFARALDHLDSPDRAHRAFESGLRALLAGWGG